MTRFVFALLIVLTASACATPQAELPDVAPERVEEEERIQRELVVAELQEEQQRLDDLIYPLMVAATEMCEAPVPRRGFRFHAAGEHEDEWAEAAEAALDLTDTVTVSGVTSGAPADDAGLEAGDRILTVDGESLPLGTDGVHELGERMLEAGERGVELGILRGGETRRISVAYEKLCPYGHEVAPGGQINAFADGENVIVPWGMMRFASDEELQVILAHEIAHNAMGHVDAMRRNVLAAGLFGALLDGLAGAGGVHTGGRYTADFAEMGGQAFSQDFEREADHVGIYIMARADLPLDNAPMLWRRFAHMSPEAIGYAYSHPASAERFVRIQEAIEEVEEKKREGLELLPDMEGDP